VLRSGVHTYRDKVVSVFVRFFFLRRFIGEVWVRLWCLLRTLYAVLSLKLTSRLCAYAQANICLQDDQRPKDDKYIEDSLLSWPTRKS
jgi:hypothetical protein